MWKVFKPKAKVTIAYKEFDSSELVSASYKMQKRRGHDYKRKRGEND